MVCHFAIVLPNSLSKVPAQHQRRGRKVEISIPTTCFHKSGLVHVMGSGLPEVLPLKQKFPTTAPDLLVLLETPRRRHLHCLGPFACTNRMTASHQIR